MPTCCSWGVKMPTPDHTAKADQFHTMCLEVLDSYITAIDKDMNRHVDQTGKPMDMTYAHNDVTRILFREIKPGVLAGMAAAAILRDIERKGRGGRG